MKDELTTKMHSEFTISKETEIKHKVFCALSDIEKFNYSIPQLCEVHGITKSDIEFYKNEYKK